MIYQVFLSVLETFIIFGVGALVWRLKWVEPADLNKLTHVTLDVFFPLLTFVTVFRNFDPARLNEFWIMPLLGLGIMVLGWVAGLPFRGLLRDPGRGRRGTFVHLCAINNYLFLPLIVIDNLWGDRELALLLILSVGSTIGFWTIGILAFGGKNEEKFSRTVLRILLSPNVLAVAAALLAALSPVKLPGMIADSLLAAMDSLGGVAVPFMLVLVGVALAQFAKRMGHGLFDLALISVLRLLLLPLLTILLLWLLPLPPEMYKVAVVVAIMPAASSSVLVARQSGGSEEFAGQVIFWTTILSLGTLPLLLALALPGGA